MAIAYVQHVNAGTGSTSVSSLTTANFGSSVGSGSLITVVIRAANAATVSSVTDTLGTTYGADVTDNDQDPAMFIWSGITSSGGTNAVTVTFGASGNFRWCDAIEVTGIATTTPLETTEFKNGTGVTDLVLDAITTTQADQFIVAGFGQNAFADYTVGADFTLIDGTIPDSEAPGAQFGGTQYRITVSALSSYVTHMTSTSSGNYTGVLATYKGAAAGGTAVKDMIGTGFIPFAR